MIHNNKKKKNYLQKETLMGFTHRNCREREYTQKLLKKINKDTLHRATQVDFHQESVRKSNSQSW